MCQTGRSSVNLALITKRPGKKEQTTQCVSILINSNKNPQNSENSWFPSSENTGNPDELTPIQKKILRELLALQELETQESRAKFLENFDWKVSTLAPDEKAKIEG